MTPQKWMFPVAALALLSACDKPAEGNKTTLVANGTTGTAPAGQDWATTVVKTEEHGYRMGNPDAAVKLVEYGALSCSHCAEFSEQSAVPLKALIAKGSVSYEFRTFMLNILDVPTSLLAKCNGEAAFFPIAERIFAGQRDWAGKAQSITQQDQLSWANLSENELAGKIAEKLELVQFAGGLGVPGDRAKACLADPKGVAELKAIQKLATEKYQVSGTPTFLINGKSLGSMDWSALEKKLKEAGA